MVQPAARNSLIRKRGERNASGQNTRFSTNKTSISYSPTYARADDVSEASEKKKTAEAKETFQGPLNASVEKFRVCHVAYSLTDG